MEGDGRDDEEDTATGEGAAAAAPGAKSGKESPNMTPGASSRTRPSRPSTTRGARFTQSDVAYRRRASRVESPSARIAGSTEGSRPKGLPKTRSFP